MPIHIKLSSTLRQYVPDYEAAKGLELEDCPQCNAAAIASRLGIPLSEIKFIMLNGRYQPLESEVRQGDRLAFFPAVGGG